VAKLPSVSIITVNYNGKKYLKNFFDSVKSLDYPNGSYEAIMVDNASQDDSVNYVRKNFPSVRIIQAVKNLGFGGGNNLGIKSSRGDLLVLVNNDTILEKIFLKEMVSCYLKNSQKYRVGAINAKLVLYDYYLPLALAGAGVFKKECRILNSRNLVNKEPFILPQVSPNFYLEKIYVPVDPESGKQLILNAKLKEIRFGDRQIPGYIILILGQKIILEKKAKRGERLKTRLPLSQQLIEENKVNLIQNAGNILFRDGFGRDRGVVVKSYQQFYEVDQGQYDQEEMIAAFCGAGVLLNRKALKEVGVFDNQFFMYYEDGDLSLRLKRKGWKILYCPKAVVRHIHAGSSQEWSLFFIYQAERGRLIFVAKQWPRLIALKEWLKYFTGSTLGLFWSLINAKDKKKVFDKLIVRLKINLEMIKLFPKNFLNFDRLSRADLKSFP
jgi:GT2 family glycosyltransferase